MKRGTMRCVLPKHGKENKETNKRNHTYNKLTVLCEHSFLYDTNSEYIIMKYQCSNLHLSNVYFYANESKTTIYYD